MARSLDTDRCSASRLADCHRSSSAIWESAQRACRVSLRDGMTSSCGTDCRLKSASWHWATASLSGRRCSRDP